MFPQNGCGIGDSDCVVPTNATITLRFDRFLNSARANRQAIALYSAKPEQGFPYALVPVYDPVERVLEYRLPPGGHFEPNTLYHLKVLTSADAPEAALRAFDGAPVEEGDLSLNITFITGDGPAEAPEAPAALTCTEIVDQVFGTLGSCAGTECHRRGGNSILMGGPQLGDAPHQLWLDNVDDFALSAINRVARQTEVADVSGGVPAVDATRFGARMALVAPGQPGASYLLYKLLLNPDSYATCERDTPFCETGGNPCRSTHSALPLAKGECVPPPDEELVRLREWFVRGEPMPRANSQGARGNIGLQGLRALSAFIASGADCP
jgi:hypothetical protein